MNEELKNALDAFKTEVKGKTSEEVKSAIEALEVKYKETLANEVKAVKDEFSAQLEQVQKHADSLDVKLQEKSKKEGAKGDILKNLIVENFDEIKTVRKGNPINIESKAVGDMTLGNNLTGDQPRDYSFEVATVPNQILNFSDLVGVVNIGGGTYTFPREGAGEGAAATQVEGSAKAQIDTDITMVDVNTDFIAGYSRYSKKMANNLPFLESFLPGSLRRKYFDAENSVFNTALAAAATAGASGNAGRLKIEALINEIANLEAADFSTNGILVTPADYWDIMITEKSTGAGYGLPGVVTYEGGQLRVNGIPVFRGNFLAANKYYVGDWSTVKKIVTEGLSVQFSTEDGTNFRDNMISARVEAQVGLAIHRTDAIIYGDFTSA